MGIWPPGVVIYRETTYCLVTYFEEDLSWLALNVFLWLFCLTKLFKLRSYQHNANILGISGSKYRHLTPCGGHTERYSLLFWTNTIMLSCKWHNAAALHHLMVSIPESLAKHQNFGSFLVEMGEFDPLVWSYIGRPPTVWWLILKRIYHG